jgi:hypothetical protein
MMRTCSGSPRDLRKAYDTALRRKATLPLVLHLGKAKGIAAERIQRMDAFLTAFTDETFGHF